MQVPADQASGASSPSYCPPTMRTVTTNSNRAGPEPRPVLSVFALNNPDLHSNLGSTRFRGVSHLPRATASDRFSLYTRAL